MTKADTQGSAAEARRKARLAEELRANLQRRKAQARSRRTGEADQRPEGLGAAREATDARHIHGHAGEGEAKD
jgi:hypothetical protein